MRDGEVDFDEKKALIEAKLTADRDVPQVRYIIALILYRIMGCNKNSDNSGHHVGMDSRGAFS